MNIAPIDSGFKPAASALRHRLLAGEPLERDTDVGQEIGDAIDQVPDGMEVRGSPHVLRRGVEIDLRAREASVTEHVPDDDELRSCPHEVRREGVAKPVRRDALDDPCSLAQGAHPLVDRVARHAGAASASKEG